MTPHYAERSDMYVRTQQNMTPKTSDPTISKVLSTIVSTPDVFLLFSLAAPDHRGATPVAIGSNPFNMKARRALDEEFSAGP